jgi:ABC-type Fe3+/spermidine/putrescine transport system ATPase subunit
VLQQYDAPQSFYERPVSAEAAHFFRNDNFLSGVRNDDTVETALGTLKIDITRVAQRDGDVTVTVRPEDVVLSPTSDNNRIPVKVLASVYMGTYSQVQLDVCGQKWLAHGPADFHAHEGETISVQLPSSRIWLLPIRNL